MRQRLGNRLTQVTGSLDDAPLELMAVSPVEAPGSTCARLLAPIHSPWANRGPLRRMLHVIASRLDQCLSTLEVADTSPFQPWLDAITVTSRDITHIVDAHVLASPAEIDANNSAGIPRIR
jgi:hypothetical protein